MRPQDTTQRHNKHHRHGGRFFVVGDRLHLCCHCRGLPFVVGRCWTQPDESVLPVLLVVVFSYFGNKNCKGGLFFGGNIVCFAMACCIVSVSVAETLSPDEPPSAHKGVFFLCVLPGKILPPVSNLREQEFVNGR